MFMCECQCVCVCLSVCPSGLGSGMEVVGEWEGGHCAFARGCVFWCLHGGKSSCVPTYTMSYVCKRRGFPVLMWSVCQ